MAALLRRVIANASLPWSVARQLCTPGIRVLMYHRVRPCSHYDQLSVTPPCFEAQMRALRASCDIVSLDDAVGRLRGGVPIPRVGRPIVAVTFDDGYLDNLVHALPVLQRWRIPATIFITTAFCDQRIAHPRYAAEFSPSERLHLNWGEVRQLAASPGITIGSHTVTHPYLSRLSFGEARAEIADSRLRIQDQLKQEVRYFCYPSGDATRREQEIAEACGYRASVTVAPGVNHTGTPLQALRRTEITDRDDAWDFRLKLRGAYDPVHGLLHRRRLRRFADAAHSLTATTEEGGR